MNEYRLAGMIHNYFLIQYDSIVDRMEARIFEDEEQEFAYRRKHEWKLWGYMDAIRAAFPDAKLDWPNMIIHYRHEFKKMWSKYY